MRRTRAVLTVEPTAAAEDVQRSSGDQAEGRVPTSHSLVLPQIPMFINTAVQASIWITAPLGQPARLAVWLLAEDDIARLFHQRYLRASGFVTDTTHMRIGERDHRSKRAAMDWAEQEEYDMMRDQCKQAVKESREGRDKRHWVKKAITCRPKVLAEICSTSIA